MLNQQTIKALSREHRAAIQAYLTAHYTGDTAPAPVRAKATFAAPSFQDNQCFTGAAKQPCECESARSFDTVSMPCELPEEGASLADYLQQVKDESFAEMLFRLLELKGMKDTECYKKANLDKRLFSKIRSNAQYRPSKATALALICALELPYAQACEMLQKAGFAFSPASKADLIVEYYIKNGIYNLLVINRSLYEFDQPLIGNY